MSRMTAGITRNITSKSLSLLPTGGVGSSCFEVVVISVVVSATVVVCAAVSVVSFVVVASAAGVAFVVVVASAAVVAFVVCRAVVG